MKDIRLEHWVKEGLEDLQQESLLRFLMQILLPQRRLGYYKLSHILKMQPLDVVQTRWGHINRNYSTLTKIQAFALDAHFTIRTSW